MGHLRRDLHRKGRRSELDASYSQSHPGTKALNSGVWRGQQLFYLYAVVSLVLGIYLTYGGFTSRSH